MKKLYVDLGENSYDIIINNGERYNIGNIVAKHFNGKKIAIISDSNVYSHYGELVTTQLKEKGYEVFDMVLQPGEQIKSFENLLPAYNSLLDMKLSRSDLIIALGGGVIGDFAGFIASTFLRGIDIIQIPTSLLAQVDSSVGGKVAVDLEKGKNLVGAFKHPKVVIIDPEMLNTLPSRNFNDGLGEVIKYGAIRDKELFAKLEEYEDIEKLKLDLENIIYTCVDIKRDVVENDEKDTGLRMILNFGHTLAHAIENLYEYKTYAHGEAVAYGMYLISVISENKGLTKKGASQRILSLLEKYELPTKIAIDDKDKILHAISLEKKNLMNKLNVILLKEIGESYIYKTDNTFFDELWNGGKVNG